MSLSIEDNGSRAREKVTLSQFMNHNQLATFRSYQKLVLHGAEL